MTTTQLPGLAEMKAQTRRVWAVGDFGAVAERTIWPVGERLVRRVGVGAGEKVLDLACGTGNAAIRAAKAGGKVTGLDLTPELFDRGRELAAQEGVEIEWVEGDAEDLPFEGNSFDVVLSTFGVMFAPRHAVAAAELLRVLRPGGRFGLYTWTPEGLQGRFFSELGAFMPPPPPFAQPMLAWGREEHVRDLFPGVHLEFDRDMVDGQPFPTLAESMEFMTANFGPVIMLRKALEPRGQWESAQQKILDLFAQGSAAEALVTIGRKP
jgi:ubiquinone/menaquinone biosynthesis C-methylase UbiE